MNQATLRISVALLLSLTLLVVPSQPIYAQEKKEKTAGEEREEEPQFEGEIAASGIFRSLLLIYAPRGEKGFNLEGNLFNSHSTTVVSVGLSKTFTLGAEGRYGRISPGLSALFGNIKPAPALTARYSYERGRIEADLFLVQALTETNGDDREGEEEEGSSSNRYDNISDGNHISYRVTEPLLIGFTWEHIQFRREQEWKYGVRAAYRIKPGWEVLAFGFIPEGGELRLGLAIK